MDNYDYGVIGNCTSAALISKYGSIDWLCLPDFASPSVFAKILDDNKGGEFGIITDPEYDIKQFYYKGTNILITRYEQGNNIFELIDFMPRYKRENGTYTCPPDIIRYIRLISGSPEITVNYNPKLGYAKYETKTVLDEGYIKSHTARGSYESVYLYTDLNMKDIVSKNKITITDDCYLLLSYNQKLIPMNIDRIILEYQRTKVYWLQWVDKTVHYSRYHNRIIRSALLLKLLSYQKTGAIIAAVTTSLPETIKGIRNWDYRYCWIRDSSMTITILTNLGHFNAAERFLKFIINAVPYKNEKIQIMYGINHEKKLTEETLGWLSGYENSRPVRIGNKAFQQKQNDIYGVLLDAILKYFELFQNNLENSEDLWTIVRSLVKTVQKNWSNADMGIWEFRSQKRHFVFSKVLCWVALDRGIKIAKLLEKRNYIDQWTGTRDRIKENILKNGWNEKVQAFTQCYENTVMDAANLLMATYGFIDYNDEKYVKTVLKIKETLCVDDLMFRYKNDDDFGKPESSFTICSFWLVKSLYYIGEKKEAVRIFEKLLTYSNHLGLFSEDLDFTTKRQLGNFPQGYSHLAIIDAAIVLSDMKTVKEEKILSALRESSVT